MKGIERVSGGMRSGRIGAGVPSHPPLGPSNPSIPGPGVGKDTEAYEKLQGHSQEEEEEKEEGREPQGVRGEVREVRK